MTIDNLLLQYYNKTVILIDLSWVLYRSYYAFRELKTPDGLESGQYFGLTNTLTQILTSYPDSLILLVDDGNPVSRKEQNTDYKANRDHSVHFDNKKYNVDSLIQCLPNVYRIYHPTLEADDLIFSISRHKDFNNSFIIYSSDKDLFQAIDLTTKVSKKLTKGTFEFIDTDSPDYVNNFKDLLPSQLPYYRACLGDASDNLPIIRPRFPSKVAYIHAKTQDGSNQDLLDTLTESQSSALSEIQTSDIYSNNLSLMKLSVCTDIPIIEKDKNNFDTIGVIQEYYLRKYNNWLHENNYL